MQNNPILDANLACIARYNPNLKYQIMQIESLKNDISFNETILHEPNLLYNGKHLHSNYGAESEAKEIFEKVQNNPLMLHVLYGFGLGYLFQEFALNSQGLVFVYEPDIEILAATLEVVDFSKELSKKNIFVFTDYEQFRQCYLENYMYNSSTTITFVPAYKEVFAEDLTNFAQNLNFVMGSAIIDNNYVKNKLVAAVKSVCNNIDSLVSEPPLGVYENIYAGKTALVVSAGPSLDKNIEVIKKYRDNVIIFAVGQATRALMNSEITPDFIGLVEAGNQMSQIEGLDTSDINLILEPLTFNALHKTNFKNKILYPSKNSIPNLIWTSMANIDPSKYISSGTVSYMMMFSAMVLGCKDIILVGQDLAFLDGKCYSNISQHNGLTYKIDENLNKAIVKVEDMDKFINSFISKESNLTDEKKIEIAQQRIEHINKNLYSVVGIKGNQLITTLDYASFIKQFEKFALDYGDNINLYNTSLEGAKINGFENIPLENLIQHKPKLKRIDLTSDFEYDLESISKNIQFEITALDEISKMIFGAKTLIANYDKEYSHRNTVTETGLKYFKQLMMLYIDLTETYCSKNRLFTMLQRSCQQELNYAMKINSDNSTESINIVYNKLKSYMSSLYNNIEEIKNTLGTKRKHLNEMLDSKG